MTRVDPEYPDRCSSIASNAALPINPVLFVRQPITLLWLRRKLPRAPSPKSAHTDQRRGRYPRTNRKANKRVDDGVHA
jgi:hypothetical protein